ncbi:GntR family transcriptional regulator [Microbacterium sp. XT11]|uniref:GntR family transcriptional regulator n=1 Tax=Microbacterium sp. XT11 TaxID=367477 RepID=UPI000830867F|nr:GntR family transcriptional regulator [Microbacterium sp. XT11]
MDSDRSVPLITDSPDPPTPHAEATITVTRRRPTVSVLAEDVFHGIASRIMNGDYPPGSRINDRALAAEFGISRTSVREAMQRLERIGLVRMLPSRYTTVTEITDGMARATWEFAGLYASNVVYLAFPHLDSAGRDHVLKLIDAVVAQIDSRSEWLPAQIALFGYFTDHSGNDLYRCLLGDSWYLILRNLIVLGASDDVRERFAGGLAALAAAVRDDEREAAARAAREVFFRS